MEIEDLILIIILTLFLLILFYRIYNKNFKARENGRIGEKKVSKLLRRINGGIVINNLTFTVRENKTCQIDHILVCNRGVFVVETKAYSGRIYGGDDQREWTQVLQYGKIKNKFYSPVKQNITHIYELKNKTNIRNIFNCVVFVKGDISYVDSNFVFGTKSLRSYILSQPIIYSDENVVEIANEINNINEEISNKEHVKNIKNMKKDIDSNICPRCGGELVVRFSNGSSFLGCSRFPKCKFTKKV